MNMFWLVLLFPLLGAILNGLVMRKVSPKVSHLTGVLALAGSAVCSWIVLITFLNGSTEPEVIKAFSWISAGDFEAPMYFLLDRLSAFMMTMVTTIAFLIHVFAGGYMHEEKETWRFFSYLNLFVFMMLLLVLGDNLLVMFIGWEGVGLCSYLLIGYWYDSDANAAAGMKAFLANRIGDIGFLLAIFLTYQHFNTISFTELRGLVHGGDVMTAIEIGAIGWITFFLFVGATGKSAQIPLFVWLPDAMAGPTPVSALIHAATMVTAGIFMMTRMNFFFYLAPITQDIVMWTGALTSLFAATIAITQRDIKKVLAYSTVSQLGYMVMACGVGAYGAGMFHVFTHACFKALLFLGAGSVIVAMHHKQDMWDMGGLKKYMPITHKVMWVGVLAIIGFPGTAGFFSKDHVLYMAFLGGGPALWAVGALTALLTSFYMVRMIMLTFHGENRSDQHTREHLHETGPGMWVPLAVLAAASLLVGFWNVPHAIPFPVHLGFDAFLAPITVVPEQAAAAYAWITEPHSLALEWGLMGFTTLGMFVSAGAAIKFYANGPGEFVQNTAKRFSGIYNTLQNKYYVDEIYFARIIEPLKEMSLFLWRIVDVVIIDGIVNGVGQACMLFGGLASFRMSGSLHRHGMVLVIGMLCLLTAFLF